MDLFLVELVDEILRFVCRLSRAEKSRDLARKPF